MARDLELRTTDETKNAAFSFLCLCYLTQHNMSKLYTFTGRFHGFIILYDLLAFHSVHMTFSLSINQMKGIEVVSLSQQL